MLTGTHIALTALTRDDRDLLFDWINTPETVRFNAPFAPVHEPGHLDWFDRITTDATRFVFGIRLLADARLIGVLQLVDVHPVHRSAEIIIRIGAEPDRGKGYGAQALKLAADFAFRDRNLQRLWLRVFADNNRAIRAYEKAGLKKEGLMRRACFIDGHWKDEVVMALLSDHP